MTEPNSLSEQEREELIAYLDGELEAEAARAVEEKLQRDPAWRREAELLQTAWEMLDYLPQAHATATFTEQTLTLWQATRSRQARWRRWGRWAGITAWAAAALLAVILGWRVGQRRPATPAEPVPPASEEVWQLLEHHHYWPYYEKVGTFSFLRELDRSGLFDEGN